MNNTIATCLFFLGFGACACQGPAVREHPSGDSILPASTRTRTPDTTSLGGSWFLQPVLPSDSATGKLPALILDLKKSNFSGYTGCNTMRGVFWSGSTDSSLSFSDKIVTTKMACPGYNEGAFMKSLRSTSRYRLRDGVLTLLSDNNTELSRWIRKPSPAPKILKA